MYSVQISTVNARLLLSQYLLTLKYATENITINLICSLFEHDAHVTDIATPPLVVHLADFRPHLGLNPPPPTCQAQPLPAVPTKS